MGSATGTATGTEKRRPRLGLLTSFLPKLTSRSGPQSPEINRKPLPASSTTSSYTSPASTVPTMTTNTARTSADSKSSSRFESGTASTTLSPIEQSAPLFEDTVLESTPPKKLHKIPAMPTCPPPPPPNLLTKLETPARAPAVTSTQATAPSARRVDRSPSPDRPPSRARLQPNQLQPRQLSPNPNPRGRSVSAQPPVVRDTAVDSSRAVSSPIQGQGRTLSKPPSEGSPPVTADKRKRKSWFPGARSRASSDVTKPMPRGAWLMSPDNQADYNTMPLLNGEKVPELWDEAGDVLVYLHPKGSDRGPSFKVADHIFSPSAVLVELLVTEMMASSQNAGYLDVAPADGPVTEGHLYLPLGNTDLERLVAARNLFALLTHQPLVGTSENPTLFAAVLQVAGLLRRFNFCSFDGSSFGESVDRAFDLFMDQTGIADVRHSREKTLEALILAEQIKSWNLYNEAFAHAVGKYEYILELKSPLYDRISVSTRQRMDRAHLDLANRQASVNTRLEAFEFPSLFSGTANSTSSEEYKNVKFKEWRTSFAKMRSFVLNYYKGLFGNWPPRAHSKKNHFSQSGLNRQCLNILYSDFCALYDLLVDRQSMTPRVIGEGHDDSDDESKDKTPAEASISALRRVLGEFDKSSPPVLPPVPFDVPKLPSMTTIYENYNELPAKKQVKYSKALQPHELQLILIKSRNIDTDALTLPFLVAYKEFELKESKGTNPADLADQRIGNWLFLYVVLQSLPMLVVDAPGLRYTEGVEDFLCQAPQGNPPWTEEAGQTRKMWFQTGSSNVVELSADVVMFSVEGIYMRSHCWLAAKEWDARTAGAPPTTTTGGALTDPTSPLQPPDPNFHNMDPSSTPTANAPTAPLTTHQHQQQHRSQSPALNSNHPHNHPHPHSHIPNQSLSTTTNHSTPSSSPHLRPRSGSTNDRARQAFRASIAIGLEPLPMPAAPAFDRSSRVLSVGSMSSGGGWGPGSGGTGSGPGSPGPGMGYGDVYQLGLRASRSAANLSHFGGGGGDYLGAGAGAGAGVGGQPRKSSYGGLAGMGMGMGGVGPSNLGPGAGPGQGGAGAGDPLGGGSTFDDILKGMDGKGKKKKKLFF